MIRIKVPSFYLYIKESDVGLPLFEALAKAQVAKFSWTDQCYYQDTGEIELNLGVAPVYPEPTRQTVLSTSEPLMTGDTVAPSASILDEAPEALLPEEFVPPVILMSGTDLDDDIPF